MNQLHPLSARLSRRALLQFATAAGLGAASASLLAACQGGTTSTGSTTSGSAPAATAAPAAAPAANQPATITWSFWGDPNELPPNDEVIKAFNAKYPNIQIKTFHEPWASYFDKI